MSKGKGKNLRITLVKSFIGKPKDQRATALGLGLKRINQQIVRKDIPEIRGMINKIPHMLKVEEI